LPLAATGADRFSFRMRCLSPRILTALLLSIIGLRTCAMAATEGSRTARPNIVVIFADDLGYKDTGFTGSDFYETPNLDALTKRGMVFNHAYAGAGNCAPSRACLHSGQYSPRTGVYAVGRTDRGPIALQRMIPIPNREDLALENVTIAEALKAAGYATALFGKWHLSGEPGTLPPAQGYDTYFDPRRPNPNQRRDEPEDPKGAYSITRAAGEFFEQNKDRPFYAFVAHHAIHSALEARPSSLAKFQAKKPGAQHKHALYAACIYDLDDTVGLLLKKLRDLGLEENTLVVFTSDNGATGQSLQEPLRGNKGAYYEGGIREPFIAVWPGRIAAGTHSDVPIINVDFYPTFLAAAGAPLPAGKILDGENLLPIFTGQAKSLQRGAIFWHFPGYLDDPVTRGRDPVFRTRPVTAMRSGDWKLLLYHEEWLLGGGRDKLATNSAVELYNLGEDPGERRDLASSNPVKRDQLLGEMLAWIKRTDAKLPSERNPKYDPNAKPTKKAGRAVD
jgi:arylsulfatase A-like enzyme